MRGTIAILTAAVGGAGVAEAAPWVREEGGWYARALGAQDRLEGAVGWRADFYGEYGLTPKVTVTAKNEAVMYPGAAEFDQDFWRLTFRRELASRGGWTAGAEAGAVYGSTVTSVFGCNGFGYEARAGAGWSGMMSGRALYGFADVAQIVQEDGCRRTRIETGYGQDLTERIFIGQQLWYEEGNQSARSIKTETQLGVHFGPVDLSLGYRQEIGGVFEESAVLVALVARR